MQTLLTVLPLVVEAIVWKATMTIIHEDIVTNGNDQGEEAPAELLHVSALALTTRGTGESTVADGLTSMPSVERAATAGQQARGCARTAPIHLGQAVERTRNGCMVMLVKLILLIQLRGKVQMP